jgi:RNA polymerase sigma-70 factor (ECF subfamily)
VPHSSNKAPAEGPEVPSLRAIFDEYSSFVWRTLKHLGVPERDIEDVCQEVFLVVHRKLAGFEGRSTLKTWVYGICLRTASDYRRRAHVRREQTVDELPVTTFEADQDMAVERARHRKRLLELLDGLDEEKRQVFVLYEIEELDMKEIAAAMGTPLQTAYSRLRAARQMLALALSETGITEVES